MDGAYRDRTGDLRLAKGTGRGWCWSLSRSFAPVGRGGGLEGCHPVPMLFHAGSSRHVVT
jgi:hypothetical protein